MIKNEPFILSLLQLGHLKMRKIHQALTIVFIVITSVYLSVTHAASVATNKLATPEELARYQSWVQSMKAAERGPFSRIRWFCEDGSVLPPKPFACAKRGGGRQHGEWTAETKTLRDNGFYVANVLASLDPQELAENYSPAGQLQAILLEQFLIDTDNGWILREAQFYRGAFQVESEELVGKKTIDYLTEPAVPIKERYWLVAEAIKHLPGSNAGQATLLNQIRDTAASLHKDYTGFSSLRNKIHGRLSADDADRVREFANNNPTLKRQAEVIELADAIDSLFDAENLTETLDGISNISPSLQGQVTTVKQTNSAIDKFVALGELSVALRKEIERTPRGRTARLRLSAGLEQAIFTSGREIVNQTASSRKQQFVLLGATLNALYGVGLLTDTELQQASNKVAAIQSGGTNKQLSSYRDTLAYLDRVPSWAERRVQFFMQEQVARFSLIEPLAHHYVPDRLRGSPLLIFTTLMKGLNEDAATLSGVRHQFFDSTASQGFRVLNAGVGIGELHTPETLAESVAKNGTAPEATILVVPETLADLPAVEGILTAFEGNQLSHVQLLARNLGVPNVVVNADFIKKLPDYYGQRIELLASAGGVVSVKLAKSKLTENKADIAAAQAAKKEVAITIDPEKLNLQRNEAISTRELSSADSGVLVGPKAAKVGGLAKQFPGRVSPGLAIPFGSFRALLDSNQHPSGGSMFEWIRASYTKMEKLQGAELDTTRRAFLKELRDWFLEVELEPKFINDLRTAMENEFGADGTYGVFVRSDTNVEDLAGFTGAGLNLTLANVVGFDNILKGIREVWASPFTERAFGWRQARLTTPEHVYTSILLHKSVPADKSGVLVTNDIFGGQANKVSVVLNEGVAGGVDGLSAETLRIDTNTGEFDWMASATAPYKKVISANGGINEIPASGQSRSLSDDDIQAILKFTSSIDNWNKEHDGAAADVEFGFLNGEFALFQIRPLVDSDSGERDQRLIALDSTLTDAANVSLSLDEQPKTDNN